MEISRFTEFAEVWLNIEHVTAPQTSQKLQRNVCNRVQASPLTIHFLLILCFLNVCSSAAAYPNAVKLLKHANVHMLFPMIRFIF